MPKEYRYEIFDTTITLKPQPSNTLKKYWVDDMHLFINGKTCNLQNSIATFCNQGKYFFKLVGPRE